MFVLEIGKQIVFYFCFDRCLFFRAFAASKDNVLSQQNQSVDLPDSKCRDGKINGLRLKFYFINNTNYAEK